MSGDGDNAARRARIASLQRTVDALRELLEPTSTDGDASPPPQDAQPQPTEQPPAAPALAS